jgi:hypothetical protein
MGRMNLLGAGSGQLGLSLSVQAHGKKGEVEVSVSVEKTGDEGEALLRIRVGRVVLPAETGLAI